MTVKEDIYEVLYEEGDWVEFDDLLEQIREDRNVSALETRAKLKELSSDFYVEKDDSKYRVKF